MTTLEKRNIKSCNTLKTNLLSPPLKLLKKYKTMLYTLFWGLCLFCNRSEEHTSELQSQSNLVCRLLLVKKQQFRWQFDECANAIVPQLERPGAQGGLAQQRLERFLGEKVVARTDLAQFEGVKLHLGFPG